MMRGSIMVRVALFPLFLGCASQDRGEADGDGAETPDADDDRLDDTAPPDMALDQDGMEAADSLDALPEPLEGCLVDEASLDASIGTVPPHPRPGRPLAFHVTSETDRTNVGFRLCGPGGLVLPEGPEVFPGSPNLWVWEAESLERGLYQARFLADPGETVYRTLDLTVEEDPSDRDGDGFDSEAAGGDDCNDDDPAIRPGAPDPCGDGVDRDCDGFDPACDFCSPPEGNILEHGEFEEGMSGFAPAGWEVRNPSAPDACPGSPDSHVYLGPPPEGCGGHSLTIDAGGTWDCYAVQTVSGYSTIEAGRTYRISAVVRSQGNAVNPAAWFILGAQWVDGGDGFFGDVKNPETAGAEDNDFDWKVLSITPAASITTTWPW
jgi:hypothetical protein